MRIWSLHPKYLDAKGLVALWRETLLAKHVLDGKTRGYKNHPQLIRFRKCKKPLEAVNQYLTEVFKESVLRGYKFDKKKVNQNFTKVKLKVTSKQIEYEAKHLLRKLKIRDKEKYKSLKKLNVFESHPLFKIADGEIEEWEKIEIVRTTSTV